MGSSTEITWTDSTINCWVGCSKVDALCKHCYAEVSTPVRVKRAKGLDLWGADAARSETKGWEANLRKWNREAQASRNVRRVFGQSLSDTFEDYGPQGRVLRVNGDVDWSLEPLRARFFSVIEDCHALTFQLLTKRPENILSMVPVSWRVKWPAHAWIGTSVGTQASADERIPHLLRVPAAVRFLSVEPQLEAVDLSRWLRPPCGCERAGLCQFCADSKPRIAWVIQGGESGSKARPFDLRWARSLRDQCRSAGVAHFLKQLGAKPIFPSAQRDGWKPLHLNDSHGGDESEWPADLRGCRAFPEVRP